VLAEYVTEGGANSHAAAAAYSLTMLGMALSFGGVWIWAVRARGLLAERVDPAAARATVVRFTAGNLAYLALVGLAFVSAPLTLAGHFLLAVYYVFNRLPDPPRAFSDHRALVSTSTWRRLERLRHCRRCQPDGAIFLAAWKCRMAVGPL
jgi:hypothetical protein